MTSSSLIDLSDLEARVGALIESEDMEGIGLIDEELRSYLNFSDNSEVPALKSAQLQALSDIYEKLTAHVSKVRDELGIELRGMKVAKKGIKAYQSSK